MSISRDIPVSVERALALLVSAARVDPNLRLAVQNVESALRAYHSECMDLSAKVRFLLDHGYRWSEDTAPGLEGMFCFPDGQIWWATREIQGD